jgi:hypothetical protein
MTLISATLDVIRNKKMPHTHFCALLLITDDVYFTMEPTTSIEVEPVK